MYHRTHTGDFKFALSGNADLPPNEDAVVPQTEDAQSLRQAAHNFANVIMDKVDDKAQAAVMAERALSEFVVEAILHRSAPRGGKIAPAFDMDNI